MGERADVSSFSANGRRCKNSQGERLKLQSPQSSGMTREAGRSKVLPSTRTTPSDGSTELKSPARKRRKLKKSETELTVQERLALADSDNRGQRSDSKDQGSESRGQGSEGSSKPPKADQLVVQLTQGLQSGDAKLLTAALEEREEGVVRATVKRLPRHILHALVKEINVRATWNDHTGVAVLRWLRHILQTYMSYLRTVPDMREAVVEAQGILQRSQHTLPSRLATVGKLHLMVDKIAAQNQVDEPNSSPEPLLLYNDESDEDDAMPVEPGASESEDWEDSDGNGD